VRASAIRQAIYLPLGAILAAIAFGFTVPGYSSLSQHLSEMGLMTGLPASMLTACIAVNGAAIIVFSLALLGWARRSALTALTSTLFGVAMLSNAIFTTGSPLPLPPAARCTACTPSASFPS